MDGGMLTGLHHIKKIKKEVWLLITMEGEDIRILSGL